MTEPEYENVDADSLSTDEIIAAMYRAGNLRWKLYPHQKPVYDAYRAFEQRVIAGQNNGPPIFVLDCARRWGKTYLVLLIKGEDAQRREKSRHTFATAIQDDIGEIIIPIFDDIYEDCPEDCKPEIRTTSRGQNFGIYYPNGSSIKLVGVDKKPKGLRGRKSDGHAWTEAAFFQELVRPVSRVQHQFQGVPHACLLMESSAPEDPEHEFDEVFVQEAKQRDAYVFQTIDDNTQLTEAEKKKYFDEACKVSVEEAERELYGKRSRNRDFIVVPEWDAEKYVHEMPPPKHAYALGGFDPGFRHLFGAVWAYYDFERACIVVQDSWAGPNASTARVACVTAARELDLYGAPPPSSLDFIPLETTGKRIGWSEYLAHDRCLRHAQELHRLSTMDLTERPDFEHRVGRWVTEDRPGQWTYFDNESRHEFMPNPHARVADVDLKLIADMRETFGFDFVPTTKVELRTMVNSMRAWFSSGRIVFLPGSGPVLDHVRIGKWSTDRARFAEHRVLGHFDCLAALVYLCRYVSLIENRSPLPPAAVTHLVSATGESSVTRLPWSEKQPHELELERRLAQAGIRPQGGRMKSWR